MQNRSKPASADDVARHLPLRPIACAVLAALAERPLPGIDILDAVNTTVRGHQLLGPGTLYRLMRELRHARLIVRVDPAVVSDDERQVHHALSPLGAAVLSAELRRLQRTIALAGRTRPAPER